MGEILRLNKSSALNKIIKLSDKLFPKNKMFYKLRDDYSVYKAESLISNFEYDAYDRQR